MATRSYSLGNDTHNVPFKMHAENRQRLLDRLYIKKKDNEGAFIVFQGGEGLVRHDTDHEPLFRQESYFHYLFGMREPDCYAVIDVSKRKTTLFVPKLPPEYAVWMGEIQPLSFYKENYEVDGAEYVEDLENFLTKAGCQVLYTLYGKNSDSGSFHKEAHFKGIEKFQVDKNFVFPELVECRVIKTPLELELLRYVNKISSDAHVKVMKNIKPGLMEYQMESIFQHHCYYHGGARYMSYACICGSGPNGSILHYGHAAAPNEKEIKEGEMVMFDMGCEYMCYASDISRSYPVNGKFSKEQAEIYNAVLASQQAVMDKIKPGVLWPDMHRLAYKVICEELKKIGLLKGDVDEMVKHHVAALFMPHGLGHFLGIDTHDPGGYPPGVERIMEPGIKKLRIGRVLEAGMVVTVEPGIYFIQPLLEPAFKDPVQSQFLNVDKLKNYMKFGGIRIEDDVIVTETGMENMTTAPRTIAEIEATMKK